MAHNNDDSSEFSYTDSESFNQRGDDVGEFRGFPQPPAPGHNRDSYMSGISVLSDKVRKEVAQQVAIKSVNTGQVRKLRPDDDLESVVSEGSAIAIGKLATKPATQALKPDVSYDTSVDSAIPARLARRPKSELVNTQGLEKDIDAFKRGHRKRFSLAVSDDLDRLMESAQLISTKNYNFELRHHSSLDSVDKRSLQRYNSGFSSGYETAGDGSPKDTPEISATPVTPTVPPRPSVDKVKRAREVSSQVQRRLSEQSRHSEVSENETIRSLDDFVDPDVSVSQPQLRVASQPPVMSNFVRDASEAPVPELPTEEKTDSVSEEAPEMRDVPEPANANAEEAPLSKALETLRDAASSIRSLVNETGERLEVQLQTPSQNGSLLYSAVEPLLTKRISSQVEAEAFTPGVAGMLRAPSKVRADVGPTVNAGATAAATTTDEWEDYASPTKSRGYQPVTDDVGERDAHVEALQVDEVKEEIPAPDADSPVLVHKPSKGKLVRESTRTHRKNKPKRAKSKRVRRELAPLKPFSYHTLINLLESMNGTVIGEEFNQLNLPVKEKQLLEKIIDSLSRLTSDMVIDQHRYEIGLLRLEKALRALEGF